MKNLCIFEDYTTKSSIRLPDYSKSNSTFQGFFFANNDDEQDGEGMHLAHASGWKVLNVEKPTHASGRKVLDVEKVKYLSLGEEMHLTCTSDQKILEDEIAKQSSPPCKKSQKVDDAEIIMSEVTTSGNGRTIKLFAKT